MAYECNSVFEDMYLCCRGSVLTTVACKTGCCQLQTSPLYIVSNLSTQTVYENMISKFWNERKI